LALAGPGAVAPLRERVAVEHRTWVEIVRFTDHHARDIIRREHYTLDSGWDARHQYSTIASHVAQILAREYSLRAHPR
jgi:hypothetical protein